MTVSSAVDASAVARVVGLKTEFVDLRAGNIQFLPQRVVVLGQGNAATTYASDKKRVTSEFEAGLEYGFGSPIHLAVRQLLPINGDGVGTVPVTVYPLAAGAGATVATGDITPVGTQTERGEYVVRVNNILSAPFVLEPNATVAEITALITAAINAKPEIPVIAVDNATDVGITTKWAGQSANDVNIAIQSAITTGVTFTLTQPVGGTVNPDVQPSLDLVGNVWETMFLNCLNISDTTVLDALATFGESRWGAIVRKPMIAFTGNTEADVNTAITVSDARKTDRTNVQLVSPGSNDLPFIVAARQLSRIAKLANNNPPHDYGSQSVSGLTPGDDGVQWDYLQRDLAVKGGSSTVEVRDGVVTLSDVVTFYHPTGQDVPPYRYVVDIIKLQNVIYNISLRFATPSWDGAPLIPDNQATSNRTARKPRSAVAEVHSVIEGLGLEAIISDVAFAKANTQAAIDTQNPKRLNVATTMKISGNANIISIDFNFGFFFGTAEVVDV
jgi:phage tail sheath gpL-like